jgi:hypothetical protein
MFILMAEARLWLYSNDAGIWKSEGILRHKPTLRGVIRKFPREPSAVQ